MFANQSKQKKGKEKSSSSNPANLTEPPMTEYFICPILQIPMRDPVVAADGFTYEREAIIRWINTKSPNALSPLTGEKLSNLEVRDNILVRQMIAAREDYERQQSTMLPRQLSEEKSILENTATSLASSSSTSTPRELKKSTHFNALQLQLTKACHDANVDEVKRLIRAGAHPNQSSR